MDKKTLLAEMMKVANTLDKSVKFRKEATAITEMMEKIAQDDGMFDKMNELKEEAMESCRLRGHDMTPWHHYSEENAVSECKRCGKEVQVLGKPAPNDIEIGGAAVALGCED